MELLLTDAPWPLYIGVSLQGKRGHEPGRALCRMLVHTGVARASVLALAAKPMSDFTQFRGLLTLEHLAGGASGAAHCAEGETLSEIIEAGGLDVVRTARRVFGFSDRFETKCSCVLRLLHRASARERLACTIKRLADGAPRIQIDCFVQALKPALPDWLTDRLGIKRVAQYKPIVLSPSLFAIDPEHGECVKVVHDRTRGIGELTNGVLTKWTVAGTEVPLPPKTLAQIGKTLLAKRHSARARIAKPRLISLTPISSTSLSVRINLASAGK